MYTYLMKLTCIWRNSWQFVAQTNFMAFTQPYSHNLTVNFNKICDIYLINHVFNKPCGISPINYVAFLQ